MFTPCKHVEQHWFLQLTHYTLYCPYSFLCAAIFYVNKELVISNNTTAQNQIIEKQNKCNIIILFCTEN
jgi:hypothetical protein